MRDIITASLPKKVSQNMRKRAKQNDMTLSAYILHLFELEKECISETEVLEKADQVRDDYQNGKTKTLTSLEELIQDT